MIPNNAARHVRLPGYLIAALLIAEQIVDLSLRNWPMRASSIQWRLGLIAGGIGSITTVLLALFIALCIGVVAEDRVTGYVVSVLGWMSAVICVLALGIFSLDALQMRQQVLAGVSNTYATVSMWVIVRLAISAAVAVVLAFSAVRIAKSGRRTAAAQPAGKPPKAQMLVGTPRA